MIHNNIAKQDIISDDIFEGGGARPIADKEIINIVKKNIDYKYLIDDEIIEKFKNNYFKWIAKSKLNEIKNLDSFKYIDYTHGTSHSFDLFYLENHTRRLRCFKGDFFYHKVSWNSCFNDMIFIEDEPLSKNDAVIISVPFSDTGTMHKNLYLILDKCDLLGIPVLIDFAYYSISSNVKINLDRECIKTVCFSLSKPFYGVERLRVGIRCRREFIDDGIKITNDFEQVTRIGAGVGYALINSYNSDHIFNKYRDKQIAICKKMDLLPSYSVIFGLGNIGDKRYEAYNRGTDARRVCISKLIGDFNDTSRITF